MRRLLLRRAHGPDDHLGVTDLVAHLETHLGTIRFGASGDADTPSGVQVVWLGEHQPFAGVTTLATLGLSKHHLEQSSGRPLHQELFMHLPLEDTPANAPAILFQVAATVVRRGRGLARGEVVGPFGPLFLGSRLTALYATGGGYVPESFDECDLGVYVVLMTMLVPITDAEATFVRENGWRAFDDLISAGEPDLTDLDRPTLC